MRPVARLLPLLLLLATPALAQPVVTSDIRDDDLARAVDVVILSEGYARGDHALFLADARKLTQQLRDDRAARPLREGAPINVHLAFVPGRDRGAPWQPGRPPRRTPFKAHVTPEGDFVTDDAAADAKAAELAPDVDLVVILVRLTSADEHIPAHERLRWKRARPADGEELELPTGPDDIRPSADLPSDGRRIRITANDTEAFLHEVGHALYGLSDEYEEYEGAPPPEDRWEIAICPNLTLEPSGSRWSRIVPTAFEGGGLWSEGVWRPERRCRMRESRSQDFCAVCQDVIRGAAEVRVPPAPTWVRPVDGQEVVLRAGEPLRLTPKWAHRGGRYGQAVSFSLDLRRLSPDGNRRWQVWWDEAEGHHRTAPLEVTVRKDGTYVLGVSASNLAGTSETVWTTFRVRIERGGATAGIVDAIDD